MSEKALAPLLAVFGIDAGQRAHGSRFDQDEFEAATEAAATMGMFTLRADTSELIALVAQLPKGKLFKSGSAFVPYIARPKYEKLLAAGEGAGRAFTRPATQPSANPVSTLGEPRSRPRSPSTGRPVASGARRARGTPADAHPAARTAKSGGRAAAAPAAPSKGRTSHPAAEIIANCMGRD